MDLFNAKALAASEARCAALERELDNLHESNRLLITQLRRMDEHVYAITQNQDSNRHMKALVVDTEHRRRQESDRIGSMMLGELNNARHIS